MDRALHPPLRLSDALRLVELRTKIISTSSVLIGTIWAALGGHFSLRIAILFALATFFVDVGTAGFNSYFDYTRGVDTVASDHEKYKVLVQGRADPVAALWISGAVFAIAAALGLVLGFYLGWELVAVGAVCMAIAYLYSGGPWPIANTPAGEWFAGGALGGVLIVLACYAQAGAVDRGALLLGLPSTVVIASILTVNNTCDIEGDRRAGRRTLSITLGAARSRVLIDAMLAMTWLLALALIPMHVLSAWAAAPILASGAFAYAVSRSMHARGYSHATKGASMRGISIIFCAYTAAILLGMALR